ncbi:MAG: hypothetical protein L6R40_000386 [Gallowayella cf. fulva]|nr:MAG: hypothetical protein L6R40_000386 [Xanthomendoza cf. fulva]
MTNFSGVFPVMASESNTVNPASLPEEDFPKEEECPTLGSQQSPYDGDIHKVRYDTYGREEEERCRAEDLRIRSLPNWTAPLPNPRSSKVWFKFRANNRYLETLSLFLTGNRQVDIDFSKRHALILFLLTRLEESYEKYARRTIPEEFEHLQLYSADEFELHVWAAFMRVPPTGSGLPTSIGDENGSQCQFIDKVNLIRQLAVHRTSTYRWNFDTATIRSAAACAFSLQDDLLLEHIELIIKVLYADAGGESNLTATEEEFQAVKDLLWPCDSRVESSHQLLDKIQSLAEESSFSFCQRYLPEEIDGFGVTAAEHFELQQWNHIIRNKVYSRSGINQADEVFFDKINQELPEDCDVRNLRNVAAHRRRFEFDTSDEFSDHSGSLQKHIDIAKGYVRALGDEETALEIERLEAEAVPRLKSRYQEWLEGRRCENRDLALAEEINRQRMQRWGILTDSFSQKENVDVRPVLKVYYSEQELQYRLRLRIRLLNGPDPESENDDSAPAADLPRASWPTYEHDRVPDYYLKMFAAGNLETHPDIPSDSSSSEEESPPDLEEGDSTSQSDDDDDDDDDNSNSNNDWYPITTTPPLPTDQERNNSSTDWGTPPPDDWWTNPCITHTSDWSATTTVDSKLDAETLTAAADRAVAIGDWGGETVTA